MIVPAELLHEVVASLPLATDSGAEARRLTRTSVRTHIDLLVPTPDHAAGFEPVQVRVRDLSAGGIGFLRKTPMRLDEPCIALLPRGETTTLAVLSYVTYWEPLSEHLIGIGARFDRILTDDERLDPKRTLALAQAKAQSLDLFADLPHRAMA